jgi:hypothetical protein
VDSRVNLRLFPVGYWLRTDDRARARIPFPRRG